MSKLKTILEEPPMDWVALEWAVGIAGMVGCAIAMALR